MTYKSKRAIALATIRADVAQNGIAGQAAIRAFCENRISRTAYEQAKREGLAIYDRTHGITRTYGLSGLVITQAV